MRDRLWGAFPWQMFDSPSDDRCEGFERGHNDKGLVCRDHKTLKDAYYRPWCGEMRPMRMMKPLRIGGASARANAVPMVVLWGLAAATAFAYYCVHDLRPLFENVAHWQQAGGWKVAFTSKAVMCGILPGAFLASIPALRPSRLTLAVLSLFAWNGVWGVICDWFFRLQSQCFGSEACFQAIVLKTVVDQFVLTPLVIAPASAVFFFWMGRDFSFARVRREWPKRFLLDLVAPNLLSNWCLWIPVTMVVFAMPLDLQIHVSGFFCAFWCLMGLEIGRRTK